MEVDETSTGDVDGPLAGLTSEMRTCTATGCTATGCTTARNPPRNPPRPAPLCGWPATGTGGRSAATRRRYSNGSRPTRSRLPSHRCRLEAQAPQLQAGEGPVQADSVTAHPGIVIQRLAVLVAVVRAHAH